MHPALTSAFRTMHFLWGTEPQGTDCGWGEKGVMGSTEAGK